MLGSIVIFLVISFGLGFFIDLLIKNWKAGILEKIVVRIGSGVLLISILGVLFNHLSIPLHWASFSLVAIGIGSYAAYKRRDVLKRDFHSVTESLQKIKVTKSMIYQILAIVIFIITANMYIKGSFAYPWLEDGDPYGYAMQSKYIAEHMTYEADEMYGFYSAPYTQGYQIFMGIMHQTNDSLYWNMKFFNALIISLSVLWFYYFMRRISGRHDIAFWGTFTLAAVPAWVSHFIFSLNYNMALMPVYFYALFSIDKSKKWSWVAGLFLGSIWINHFYTAVIITGLTGIIILSRFFQSYRIKQYFATLGIGLTTWLIFLVPTLIKHKMDLFGGGQIGGLYKAKDLIELLFEHPIYLLLPLALIAISVLLYFSSDKWSRPLKKLTKKTFLMKFLYFMFLIFVGGILIIPDKKILYTAGTATRAYVLKDFFIAQYGNLINNPVGIGFVLMSLFTIGCLFYLFKFNTYFSSKKDQLFALLNTTLFSFIGLMGIHLSIGFSPFRMWTFFGFFVAVITGYFIAQLLSIANKRKLYLASLGIIVLIVLGGYATSFKQKEYNNTAMWPEHWIMDQSGQAEQLFIWMREGGLPKDSMVMPLCNVPRVMFGYDMMVEAWKDRRLYFQDYYKNDSISLFYKNSTSYSVEELHDILKGWGYEYAIMGIDCLTLAKQNETVVQQKLQELASTELFSIINYTKTEFLFKVN